MARIMRRAALTVLAVLLAVPGGAGEPAAVRRLRLDLASVVGKGSTVNAREAAVAAALFAALAADDTGLAASSRHHLPDELANLEGGGRVAAANAAGAALVLGGLVTGQRRGWVGGLTLLEGNLLLGITLDLAKSGFGRARPLEPHHGQLFRGGESFPSSHAAHAFLIASVVDRTFGRRWVSWAVYPLATAVALSRLQNGTHHPTDVAAGALLGWWIGHRLSQAHGLDAPGRHRPALAAVPVSGGGLVRLAWRW